MTEDAATALSYRPVTPARWTDLEALFGPRGADSGCWCMWWRLKRKDWEAQAGEGNRRALKAIVEAGREPGLLGYAGDQPVIWCSVAPRDEFPVLDRSPVLKRIDDQPVWSLVCFFVARGWRRHGLMLPTVRAAVDYAAEHGANIIEGYPVEPQKALVWSGGFTGVATAFMRAGFVEVLRRKPHRPIMRYYVEPAA